MRWLVRVGEGRPYSAPTTAPLPLSPASSSRSSESRPPEPSRYGWPPGERRADRDDVDSLEHVAASVADEPAPGLQANKAEEELNEDDDAPESLT